MYKLSKQMSQTSRKPDFGRAHSNGWREREDGRSSVPGGEPETRQQHHAARRLGDDDLVCRLRMKCENPVILSFHYNNNNNNIHYNNKTLFISENTTSFVLPKI